MTAENRTLVTDYYTAIWSGGPVAPDIIEHQATANFSAQGLADYIAARRAAHPAHQIIIHHTLSEDDFVFLFVEEKLEAGEDFARAELFRLDQGKIAEHWSAHVRDEKQRKNQNGTFDGPKVDRSKDYAQRFGAQFEALDLRGFDGGELETFAQSRVPEYRQHSPKGGDGLSGLVDILGKAKAAGIKVSMQRHRTLRDGDFLMSHRLYQTTPPHPLMTRINTFDLFRLDAQGRAVEHWDVMEDVPEAQMLARMF
jgi:predicted SnoaL-like aldol condensation-catalyzing enzyme